MNPEQLSYPDLKKLASSLGIKATGVGRTKEVLIKEIKEHQAAKEEKKTPRKSAEKKEPQKSPRRSEEKKEEKKSPRRSEQTTPQFSPQRETKQTTVKSAPKSAEKQRSNQTELKEQPTVINVAPLPPRSPRRVQSLVPSLTVPPDLKERSSVVYNKLVGLSVLPYNQAMVEGELKKMSKDVFTVLDDLVRDDVEGIWTKETLFGKTWKELRTLLTEMASANNGLAAGLILYNNERPLNVTVDSALLVRSYDASRTVRRLIVYKSSAEWLKTFNDEGRNIPLVGYLLTALYDADVKTTNEVVRLLFSPSIVTQEELMMVLPELLKYENVNPSVLLRLILGRRSAPLLQRLVETSAMRPIDHIFTDIVDFSKPQDMESNVRTVLATIAEVNEDDLSNAIAKVRISGNKVVLSLLNALKADLETQ